MPVLISQADASHIAYVDEICHSIEQAALKRGTGIAKRSPEYIKQKILEGKAVIALSQEGQFAGFCYMETWQHGKYLANSGLIVSPQFQKMGLARKIKAKIFEVSRKRYPEAKMFSISTSLAVLKINSELGYKPVTFSELTKDESFWKGCSTCINYDILNRTEHKMCLCTAMLMDPEKKEVPFQFEKKKSVLKRILKIKRSILLKMLALIPFKKKVNKK